MNPNLPRTRHATSSASSTFGFEVFEQGNCLEQLLINYANERFHNFFIKHFFKMEELKYEREGIDYSAVTSRIIRSFWT